MTAVREKELDEMINAGNIDALKGIKDVEEQKYVMRQMINEMTGGKIKDEETKNRIIKDCVEHRDPVEDMEALKAWLDTYTVKDERLYAKRVFKLIHIFSTNDVEDMSMHLDEIKQLPRELLPEDILHRIDQLDKIKDMTAEEMNEAITNGVKMISTLIDSIKTVYDEHEIMFDIAKIALDLRVYSDDGTLIHTRVTTPAIEEAYAKNNSRVS